MEYCIRVAVVVSCRGTAINDKLVIDYWKILTFNIILTINC